MLKEELTGCRRIMKRFISGITVLLVVVLAIGTASVFAADIVLSPQKITVDGEKVTCEAYNVDGYNYFKLRDVAELLNGTGSSFSVDWNEKKETVSIVKGEPYKSIGSELKTEGDKSDTALKSKQTIIIDGETIKSLPAYNIGGSNYFKLRELGKALDFDVDYDEKEDTVTVKSKQSDITAEMLQDMKAAEIVEMLGPVFTADQSVSGILASVSMAQFILESGYGKSDLALNANNCFGMKAALSKNGWDNSKWDGVSVYTKYTEEQDEEGNVKVVSADFRKYDSIADSIADHSAYLLNAKNKDKLRYEGIKGCTDYREAIQIIKDGGYATATDYVERICEIIEQWNLTRYDLT